MAITSRRHVGVRPDSVNLDAKPSPLLKTLSEVEGSTLKSRKRERKATGNTQHLVRSPGCGASPHSKRENDMSSCPSGGPGRLTPERNEAPSTAGTPRFGALSHHSFFSRHNPHPHRVRHIQGLNGRPVCTVRDDWLVSSSLFPHPLLKSHVQRQAVVPASLGKKRKKDIFSSMFSEAWRDELRELAAKVVLAVKMAPNKLQEPVRRQTRYSAQTGRLVPASAKSHPRRPPSQHLDHGKPFHDQELMVLELLCQILQTDSLRAVQQWLLLAGHRGDTRFPLFHCLFIYGPFKDL
uniref:Thymus, brain and testes associated n=1 Tax=Hippocampus comes TaxID=109280 RepID=A0A3Q3D1S7_HIPCM